MKKQVELNPVKVKIDDETITKILKKKKYKRATYRLVPVGLLFTSGAKNDTEQIFLTTNGLSNAEIYNLLAVVNLEQIKNLKSMKGTSHWVSVTFDKLNNTQKSRSFWT